MRLGRAPKMPLVGVRAWRVFKDGLYGMMLSLESWDES